MELKGDYKLGVLLISASIFIVDVLFNIFYFHHAPYKDESSDKSTYLAVFLNLCFILFMASPLITKYLDKASFDEQVRFLGLSDREEKIDASVFKNFISDQALGAFLGTAVIYFGKESLQNFGPVVAAAITFVIFVAAVILMCLALIRFISHFINYGWFLYIASAVFAFLVMFSFFSFGLDTAT